MQHKQKSMYRRAPPLSGGVKEACWMENMGPKHGGLECQAHEFDFTSTPVGKILVSGMITCPSIWGKN